MASLSDVRRNELTSVEYEVQVTIIKRTTAPVQTVTQYGNQTDKVELLTTMQEVCNFRAVEQFVGHAVSKAHSVLDLFSPVKAIAKDSNG